MSTSRSGTKIKGMADTLEATQAPPSGGLPAQIEGPTATRPGPEDGLGINSPGPRSQGMHQIRATIKKILDSDMDALPRDGALGKSESSSNSCVFEVTATVSSCGSGAIGLLPRRSLVRKALYVAFGSAREFERIGGREPLVAARTYSEIPGRARAPHTPKTPREGGPCAHAAPRVRTPP